MVEERVYVPTNEVLLDLQNVTKHFGGLAAVQDVNLQVRRGEIISVIGPNGAGKTTVFNLITGIYHVSSGDIVLDGKSILGLARPGTASWYRAHLSKHSPL